MLIEALSHPLTDLPSNLLFDSRLMRLFLTVCLCAALALGASPADGEPSLECDVEKILEARELPPGSMVAAGTYGELTEVPTVLFPRTLEQGKYEITFPLLHFG